MKRNITMVDPHFSEVDREIIHSEIDRILDGALSMGPNVRAFESDVAERVGVGHAIAMNSCTSALEAALLSKDVAGKEVIVPVETYIATGMAVHLVGATPVFAEISEATLCLDLQDVKKKVTKKTAGVILVHMAGLITPDVLEFRQFCNDNNLLFIEDAAHSPGAQRNGREAGSFGDVGCFSFYPTKVVTAAEGGMLTTDNDDIAAFARSYQHRGRDLHQQMESYVRPGRNVRMTEISALLGRVQFSHLDDFLRKRRQIAATYQREFANQQNVTLLTPEKLESSSFWKVPLLFEPHIDRQLVIKAMADYGITVDSSYQPALHLQPVFKKLYGTTEGMLPKSEWLLSRHICLPCHPRMTEQDAVYVADTLRSIISDMSKSVKKQDSIG